MRRLFFILVIPVLVISCTKKDVVTPVTVVQEIEAMVYEDANISVRDFKAQQTENAEITVSFTTLYEKNITKIEVMSGITEDRLCTIYKVDKTGNSSQTLHYAFSDADIESSAIYYMIRYTLNDGNWGYTSVYKYQ